MATVALARAASVGQALRRAVALAGGLDFIAPGAVVLLKPNVNSPDPFPFTTNPEVVYEAVRLVWERDPRRVIVGDRSWYKDPSLHCLRRTGIYDAAGDAGAEVIPFDDGPWQPVHPEGADHWPEGYSIPGLFSLVDHIISLPVVKAHRYATFTMALKNLVGCIRPEERLGYLHSGGHQEPRLGSLIAEIGLAVRPSLVIMDATRALVTGGPTAGDVAQPGIILASPDPVANDAVGLALLQHLGTTPAIAGKPPWEQPQLKRAAELGLGAPGPEAVALVGEGVPELEELRTYLGETPAHGA